MERFSQKTTEELRYYVYCLFDTRTQKIFYIGKGQGNRVFDHMQGAIESDAKTEKIDTILEILKAGQKIDHYIIRHGLDERVAIEIEAAIIDLLTFRKFEHLSKITNLVAGHYSWDRGLRSAQEIEDLYAAKPIYSKDIKHRIMIININRQYQRGVDPYEATRKWWKLNIKRAKKAEYIISEYRGIFRKIYKPNPESWVNHIEKKKVRWSFEAEEVCNKDILDLYRHKEFKDKKKGTRNPIRYINII